MEKKNKSNIFNKRNLKYGSNSIILVVAFIAIAVLLNVIVGMGDLKLDLTPNKLFSLSDATKKELDGLKQEVQIYGLFDDGKVSSGNEIKEVTDLLNLYSKYPNVIVKYVDPERNPGFIKQLDPDGTLDIQSQDFVVVSKVNGKDKKKKLGYYDLFAVQMDEQSYRTYKTGSNAEQGFTGAIKYVTAEKTPVVYFTEGHDEFSIDSDYSDLKSYIEKNNYLTQKINLYTVDKIPDDAAVVVVASPKKDLAINERDVLQEYLRNGGKAIFLFDYLESDPSYDQFNALLSGYNVAVDYDKVKETDQNKRHPNDEYTVLLTGSSNAVISENFITSISNARSISVLKNTKEYVTTIPMLSASETALGEMVPASRGADLKGPLDIAVAVENKGGNDTSRIFVAGNASFVSNDAANSSTGNFYRSNIEVFLRTINWMTEKKDEIIVPTKNYEVNQLQITELQSGIMGGVLVIVFPLLILGTGLAVFLRRRHL